MLPQADSSSWNEQAAAHLLDRAAFGGTPKEIAALQKLGRGPAIESLLTPPAPAPLPALSNPEDLAEIRMALRDLTPEARLEKGRQYRRQNGDDMMKVRTWWFQQMMRPEAATLEKATLFWHGHFATSFQKVKNAHFMLQQNQLLRKFAFGNFRDLVKALSCDPAMVIWLDLQQSREGAPNENFARELMELFTLGIGHYSEDDIKSSARAFTGYRARLGREGFVYIPQQHDSSDKTFMGKTGPFGGDDIIDLICDQAACAEFICDKIWTFYAYEDPEPEVIFALADTFRRGNYEIRPVLVEMFGSAAFNTPRAIGTQVKSPTQLIVQTSRVLESPLPPDFILQLAMRGLGQILFTPPNVKGWDGNRAWINTATLANRSTLTDGMAGVEEITRNFRGEPALEKIVTNEMLNQPEKLVDGLCKRLLSLPIDAETREDLVVEAAKFPKPLSRSAVRGMLAKIMRLPEFQLT